MTTNEETKEAMWLKGICSELGLKQDNIKLNCYFQRALTLAHNQVNHKKTKHIYQVQLHSGPSQAGHIVLSKIRTTVNRADFLTKRIPGQKFQLWCEVLNIH